MLITPVKAPTTVPSSGYLLVEPSNLVPGLYGSLPDMKACVPPSLWKMDAFMPRLLRLDNLSVSHKESVSQILVQEGAEQYPPAVCGWLQSDKGIEELSASVARMILGDRSNEGSVIWRYFDPRVFILVAHLFTEEQGSALLGAIDCWTFPWRRQWWSVQRTCSFMPSLSDLDNGWPSSAQWELLDRSRIFQRIHMRLHTNEPPPSQCIDDLSHSVSAFRETARYLHFNKDDDRGEFAFLSTRYRKHFRTAYDLAEKWSQLRERKIALREMLACVTPACIENMENSEKRERSSHAKFEL